MKIDCDKIEQIINNALDKKLEPIKKELSEIKIILIKTKVLLENTLNHEK